MLNLSHAISHLLYAISHAILYLSHTKLHLSQTFKNLKRYDCLNVWKQLKNFPGGIENKSDVFRHVIRKRIFVSTVFFIFAQKRNEKGGWDGSLTCFFTTFASGFFEKIILVVFAQKRNEKGDWNDSLTCFFLETVVHYQLLKKKVVTPRDLVTRSHETRSCRFSWEFSSHKGNSWENLIFAKTTWERLRPNSNDSIAPTMHAQVPPGAELLMVLYRDGTFLFLTRAVRYSNWQNNSLWFLKRCCTQPCSLQPNSMVPWEA